MKIWAKYLIGIIIGCGIALVIGDDGERAIEILTPITTVVVHITRYVLFPLVLLSTAVGIYELKRELKVIRVVGRTLLYLIASSLLLSIIGATSTLVFSPERIPIVIEEEVTYSLPSFVDVLTRVFPKNLFEVFIESGDFLLPIFALAVLIGLNLNFDRLATRPAIQALDSFTRIFYNINAFILEILAVGFIPIGALFLAKVIQSPEMSLYRQLLLILTIDTLIVILCVYPLLLYFLAGKRNPFRWIYATLATIFAGFASGDAYFTFGTMIRHGKESLGIPRKSAVLSMPLFVLFGRAGTAMVTGASFILIITSYSSLGLDLRQTLWVIVGSFYTSFILGPFPALGVFIALSVLSGAFESGYAAGYLILKPVVPFLMSFAVVVDSVTALLGSMLVARHEGLQEEIEVKEFI